ncbi:hypothetical protein MB14_10310 [Roseivirga ehrenbergii]|uniref:Tetratricopeptide repeat protein n=1 Tax=Roseivirga ehrenbergii (strain DSM 102268 / JCM 13514 / KCTC 12282 / NCIMB 14502 / KMM 6017) TaxID=279360 RepID=A0A150WYZ1_ROSEK|nr:hypothetical protein MB14_10310 [Roseivirga ehrenbergii]
MPNGNFHSILDIPKQKPVNRERFNQLLGNLHQVTNEDIKSLNDLRKKYPFFQTPYVIVAKALKDRNHPKTDAFIKKAAIYSPNRAHLKKIILGEISFEAPQENTIKKKQGKTIETPETSKEIVTPKAETETETVTKEAISKTDKDGPQEEPIVPQTLGKQNPEINQLEKDLLEIKERKLRLAKMFEGQEETKTIKAETTPQSNKSQVELIEKFIQNEPRFENKKGINEENEYTQEDLAAKHMKSKDEFVTETLAKLLLKQKKYTRAIDIYKKLSLKFPEKRTYFASQIQKIKEVQNV